MKTVDITDQRFGSLIAKRAIGRRSRSTVWLCVCDCGGEAEVQLQNLRSSHTRSCGSCKSIPRRWLHGREGSYSSWRLMMRRCYDKNSPSYKNYGARGIRVQRAWHRFGNFHADMGDRPKGMFIERKDSEKGYTKNNCCWATRLEQNRNRKFR